MINFVRLQTNKKKSIKLGWTNLLWHSDIQRLYLRIRRVNHHELGSDDPLVQWLCTFLEMHRSRIRYSGKWLNIAHFLLLAHLLRLERLFGSLNGNSSSNSSNSGLFSHGSLMTPFIQAAGLELDYRQAISPSGLSWEALASTEWWSPWHWLIQRTL